MSVEYILLYHYLKYAIVIGPTRVTLYVQVISVANASTSQGNIHAPGQHYRATLPGNMTLY